MIGNLDDLGPWRPTEAWRYVTCPRHTALERWDDDTALEYAEGCPDCVVAYRDDA